MIYAKKNGRVEIQGTPLCRLVTPAGLEPAITDVKGRCLNHFDYGVMLVPPGAFETPTRGFSGHCSTF